MDAVVIAEDDDHFGARERPERLVQQRNDVRRTGPAARGCFGPCQPPALQRDPGAVDQ